ncbi:serine/threonine-protein kinase [Nocardia brasiliensis]|uniref:serine/threonine-protein kinase n=1 Tax=Nocardia brasiliensis TaxID=37326 RepID=UPI001894A569|nr:serine/threonine-protein kinase [Nocardia brasiliensis]MBF6124692.1 serine/threonine protein kinase [Nocardia brasiliensis]
MRPLGPHDPRTAGRHQLIAVIGQGAMGRVLLGRAPDGRLVAVKMIHRHLARNAEFRARFRLEVQASQRVTGAYTAAVMDADADAEDPWLASVFVPGPALREAVDQHGPLPLGGLRLLTAGLGSALLEIHRAGMIHRDLKPTNVLLAADGPRVIDFGIARALAADVQLTTTGTLVGSPAYMSPEQASGLELSTASDVFSVGAMLYMAATGDSPFLGASAPQTLYNVVHDRPDTSRIPPVLRPVVEACLDKNPLHRPTPRQLIDSVATMPARSGWPGAVRQQITRDRSEADRWAAAGGNPAAEPPRRGRTWLAAGTVLVLAAAGTVTGLLLSREDPPSRPDPLANRTLELSDAQLRLIDTCALLGPDVVGGLGQPVEAEPTESAVCETRFIELDGRQTRMRVRVGTPVASGKPLSEPVAGRTVLDTTAETGSCGRALTARDGATVGVEVTISAAERDSCGSATEVLKAVATRLVLDPPQAKLPDPSVVRMDPCAAVAPGILDAQLGSGVRATPGDVHTCTWAGATTELTVRLTEAKRVDTDPKYTTLFVDGGKLGDFDSARRIDQDGTCVTVHLVRSTVGGRGDLIVVSARPSAGAPADSACATTEAVLTGVVDAVRRS